MALRRDLTVVSNGTVDGMSKRLGSLASAIAFGAVVCLSGAAQAGLAGEGCGDCIEEGNESCDDCNTVVGDGCSANCIAEICGDDILEPETEECDDGNTTDGDGCAADCTCGPEVCGDGIDGCLEECDDGNTVDGDGCSATCTEEFIIEPPGKGQLACINAINKNLAGVVKAQLADNATCVKDVSNGKQPTFATCYGTDLKGKVGKAQTKVGTTNGKKCNDPDEVPTMAYTDPTTVGNAGEAEVIESTTTVLGAAPTIILKADKPGAKCQQEIMKQLGAIGSKWAAEANKAKKNALKGSGGVTQAKTEAELAMAIDTAVGGSTSLDKAETKATHGITGKCDDTQANAAADCGGATTAAQVAACVIAAGEQASCEALELADGIDLNCPTIPVLP
jgi:cysteine-rich repeat protein